LTARDFFYARSGLLRAPWRILGFLVVLFIAATIFAYAMSRVLSHATITRNAQMASFLVLLAAALVAHAVMLRLVDRRSWATIGLAARQATPRALTIGLALGALGILVPSGVLLLAHWLRPESVSAVPESWGRFALLMAVFFLPQALTEELLFRGYIFAAIRDAVGWRWALLLTSIVFGLLHSQNPGANIEPLVIVTLAGFFLGGILLLTDSLWAAWMAHFAWNWSMAALLHTAVSGIPETAPGYRVIDAGPDWATGGTWGPEGGAFAAVGMLVGLWILAAWRRRAAHDVTVPESDD
jgi:membrane protease YdiL (CAAX protease family)